jgi:hypothetical protein
MDGRAFALKASIHEDFNILWKALVNVDVDAGSITIQNSVAGEQCGLGI